MKTATWRAGITDNGKIALLEHAINLPQDQVESHLIMIGLLEDLKQHHLDKLRTLYEKTIKKGDDDENM